MAGWGTAFDGQKYLNLESFRRSGAGVRTPLWFAAAPDGTLFVYTLATSGKAKRIRHTQAVRIAPCDVRGATEGPWFDAIARLAQGPEFDRGMRLINRKYGLMKRLLDLGFLVSRRQRAVIALSAP